MFVTNRLGQMTKGGIAGFLAVLALSGVAAFFWVARTVNTTPAQCVTCHAELTAMWKRSQGHPADRVTCYECHAQHAELPESANLGAFVRDQLIPEKYLASDERIAARCEGCHEAVRTSGTGLGAAGVKDAFRSAAGVLASAAPEDRGVPLSTAVLPVDGAPVQVRGVGASVVRYLRDREWIRAARSAYGPDWAAALTELRSELEAAALLDPLPEPTAARPEEADNRLRRALGALRESCGELLEELPRGPLPEGQGAVRVTPAVLRPLAETKDPGIPVAVPGPVSGPSALTDRAIGAAASVAAELGSVEGREDGVLEADASRLWGLVETLSGLRNAFHEWEGSRDSEGPGARGAAAARLLEEGLRLLPLMEAEEGLVLEVAADMGSSAVGPGGFVELDLGEFLGAALAPLEELERGLERRKLIKANHKLHLVSARDEQGQPLGLGCLDCHRNLVHDKGRVETNRPTMAGCFAGQCHQKDRNKDNCRRCHYQHLTEPGQEVL